MTINQNEADYIYNIMEIFRPLVLTFFLLHFLGAFNNGLMENTLTPKEIRSIIFRAIATFLLIENAEAILSYVFAISNNLLNFFSETGSTQYSDSLTVFDHDYIVNAAMACDRDNMWESYRQMASRLALMVFGYGFQLFAMCIALILCYIRKIKIALRSIFFSITIPSFVEYGFRSKCIQYLELMATDALIAGFYMLYVHLALFFQTTTSGTTWGAFIMPFALIVTMATTDAVANNLVKSIRHAW